MRGTSGAVKILPESLFIPSSMSMALIFGCLWVLVASIVAFLPMRRQYAPGLALLVLAPGLLGWIAVEHGGGVMVFGLFAFVSMFRNPLIFLIRYVRGERPEVPR